ncbi:hypothetical protein [Gallaecimonas xiamenensis]|uniref:Uncharacterized protein n=1 Tax=Gallaecimonas xiamenensis 3-C-1 TaxID=745411 RepID=K2JB45_9GAMM|nr:hypothetical protein [Gallaecimonas xiamenensis]EKE67764.1 hypothetical protein B3C1_18146 [Gallaecimonas xiamenensis 3-C-1]
MLTTADSPNRYYRAVLKVRICGEQPITQVTLEPQSFWHFANHQLVWVAEAPADNVQLSWQGERDLTVSYPDDIRVTKAESLAMGVDIHYLPQSPILELEGSGA